MRRRILAFLLSCVSVPAFAQYVMKDNVVPSASTAGAPFPQSWDYQGYAEPWTAGSSYTLTQICYGMKLSAGTPFDQAITGKIYSSSNGGPSGTPNTLLATSSSTHQYTATSSFAYYCWQFAGLAVTSGTTYYAALSGTASSTNYVKMQQTSSTGFSVYGLSGSWTVDNPNLQGALQTYSGNASAPTSNAFWFGIP